MTAKTAKTRKRNKKPGQTAAALEAATQAVTLANAQLERFMADPGPIVATLSINRITGATSVVYQAQTDEEYAQLLRALGALAGSLTAKRLAAAEARGEARKGARQT